MRRSLSRYSNVLTCLLALLLFLPSTAATRAWAQATTGYTLETYPGVGSYVRSTDSAHPLPTGAMISASKPLHIDAGNGFTAGDYTVTGDGGSGYAVLSVAPASPTTGQVVTGGAATVANFVKVTGPTGLPVITSDNQIQVPVPAIASGSNVGTVQVRIRIFSSITDTNPTNSAWVSYTGPGQVLSMAIPSQYQNTGKNLPQVVIGVKDDVAEWPACGWLAISGYNVAKENSDRYSSYNPFAAPKTTAPTDAQILAALPLSRLTGKHISVVPVGDSITHGLYLEYPALLNSLYPGKFTYYDGGVSGSTAAQWLPSATGITHPSSSSSETYYNYVLHRAQEATAAGDVVVIPYCLGHNVDGNQIADDQTIISALTAALPNAYILVRPTRTTHKVEFTGPGAGDPDGFYFAASDAQRALADASSTDKILHGSEEFFPFFFSNQSLIDTGVTHPLPGEGQAAHAHIEVKSLAQSLAIIFPGIASITISPATITLTSGQTSQTFVATAKDSGGTALSTQPTFTWAASAPVVSSGGVLTVPTTYTVSATASGVTGTATVTVAPPTIYRKVQ